MGKAGPQGRERAPRDAIEGADRRDTLLEAITPSPSALPNPPKTLKPVTDLLALSHWTPRGVFRGTVLHGAGVAWRSGRRMQQSKPGYFLLPMSRRLSASPSCFRHRSGKRAHRATPERSLQTLTDMATCKNRSESSHRPPEHGHRDPKPPGTAPHAAPLRLLRLRQVMDLTALEGPRSICALSSMRVPDTRADHALLRGLGRAGDSALDSRADRGPYRVTYDEGKPRPNIEFLPRFASNPA